MLQPVLHITRALLLLFLVSADLKFLQGSSAHSTQLVCDILFVLFFSSTFQYGYLAMTFEMLLNLIRWVQFFLNNHVYKFRLDQIIYYYICYY
jgi:hypothetical protein